MNNSSAQKALDLFESFRNNSLYMAGGGERGCHYRAHLIALDLEDETDWQVGKIWCWANEHGDIKDIELLKETSVGFKPSYDAFKGKHGLSWNFHVAAVAQPPDSEPLVFDPALYDGPVTLKQWQEEMEPIGNRALTTRQTRTDCHGIIEARDRCKFDLYPRFTALAKHELGNMRFLSDEETPFAPVGRSEWLRALQPA